MRATERIEADVCVVGAGYAGLTAALRVAQGARSVVVLEARERIGGRVWKTSPVMNGFIDGAVRSGERAAEEVLTIEARGDAAAPTSRTA